MTRSRSLFAALIGVLAVVCLAAGLLVLDAGPRERSVLAPRALAPSAVTEALRTLHRWDRSRSRAWAAGSTRRLGELYLPGSAAGAADLRLLRRYRDRGVRVTGMGTQLLSLAVLQREPGRLRLRVTDRVTGAVAIRGDRRAVLPRDASSTRVLELRRGGDGRWRVGAVTDAVS